MQVDLADLRAENRMLRTPTVSQSVRAPRQAMFTTTKVPQFDGTTRGGCIERALNVATTTWVI